MRRMITICALLAAWAIPVARLAPPSARWREPRANELVLPWVEPYYAPPGDDCGAVRWTTRQFKPSAGRCWEAKI